MLNAFADFLMIVLLSSAFIFDIAWYQVHCEYDSLDVALFDT